MIIDRTQDDLYVFDVQADDQDPREWVLALELGMRAHHNMVCEDYDPEIWVEYFDDEMADYVRHERRLP